MIITPVYKFKGELLGGEYRTDENYVRLERFVRFFEGHVMLSAEEIQEIMAYLEQDFEEEQIAVPIRRVMVRYIHRDDVDLLYKELSQILKLMKGEGIHAEVSGSDGSDSAA